MVVSFLQSQQENKKPIKIGDGNIGRMFIEFLWYYGLVFDHTKYVIYAYPTDGTSEKDTINFLYVYNNIFNLIIEHAVIS
jgi:DNA polymerase sigma